MDTLECIYTARIEAWTVDNWTRVRTVHSNHHLKMTVIWCLICLFQHQKKINKIKYLSHTGMIERGVWSGYSLFAKTV